MLSKSLLRSKQPEIERLTEILGEEAVLGSLSNAKL